MSQEQLGGLDDEATGGGGGEKSDEVFRDKYKKTQQQIQAIKKAEGKARAKDDRLATVIGRFLQSNTNTELMLLITRCLARNIPAGLILGLLALTEKEAKQEFELLMGEAVLLLESPDPSSRALVVQASFDAAHLPENVKKAIDAWGHGLLEFGLTQPTRLLATAISPEGEIFPSLTQLATVLLRQYLASQEINAEYESTYSFAELLLKNVLDQIAAHFGGIKALEAGAIE